MASPTHGQKHGPWSKPDKKFIADNCNTMSPEKIASKLRRNLKTVKKYIYENHRSTFSEAAKSAEYDIYRSPIWKDLRLQFSEEELHMFLYHWGRIISQFRDDVYPTEEIQVVDTIKLELLMNRCLKQQQQCMQDIRNLEIVLETERRSEDQDQQNTTAISTIERQIAILRAAQDSLNSDFKTMLTEKNKILKEMKATRDARIKNLESNKHNFFGLITQIINDRVTRSRIGTDMEKMRLAMEVELERLSEYHVYDNGEADQPILTPENVLE